MKWGRKLQSVWECVKIGMLLMEAEKVCEGVVLREIEDKSETNKVGG